ncbi:MAG: N-acetyl-gamma-glutamyl-phosphate reductase [Candidatus Binatia bacterium]|nr:MAG: N-acetyl-gamma-glutamyl-phosphate reductase [Candidatus Binatia bacterium]
MSRVRVAVLGASGYAGAECVRWLARHPGVEISCVTAEQHAGALLDEVHPGLRASGRKLEPFDAEEVVRRSDVVLAALPEERALEVLPPLVERGRKVVDLSGAFRIRDPEEHRRWYRSDPFPEARKRAVYGLSELYRDEIRTASFVANPGCYPTGILLGLAPLLRRGLVRDKVVADAKSGVTGARRKPSIEHLFAELGENLKAYSVLVHRHVPEMRQEMGRLARGTAPEVLFVPHLVPVRRGILTTLYVRLARPLGEEELGGFFAEDYGSEPFVVLARGRWPELREVRGTNLCAIGWTLDADRTTAVVVTALDNLGKGAAGQAVQNLNLLCGFPETQGLEDSAWLP